RVASIMERLKWPDDEPITAKMVNRAVENAQRSIEELRREIYLKFTTQYVDENSVPPQAIQLKREGGAATLRISYEKRVPFVYNIDLVATFDKSVNLTNAAGD
ncbi:MAG TPA: DUF4845 domain-containing protein, partial [Rhodanobacteraceae bacterium]|nr:DUF4845 domain-containing protein [Rhodanobacteraceae bacterium]